MGNSTSQIQISKEKAKSEAIDKQLEEDGIQLKRQCTLLLLGSGESGKSTIIKQMKIIYQNGYTTAELATFRPVIYKNVLESAQAIIKALPKFNLRPVHAQNRILAEKIRDYSWTEDTNWILAPEIAEAIYQVVQDPVVSKVMNEHLSEFYLMDSAVYFFAEVLRIGAPGYVPTVTDVLRARSQTTAFTETRFLVGQLSMHLLEVGNQRSERRKWIHFFENVTSIIFCTALSDYDQVLFETKQNRMAESLMLFESIVNSRWFLRTSIILFLNKTDVFKSKLPRVPLEKYFPEYTGGSDVTKAVRYIMWKFMQANRARLSVYPHITDITDCSRVKVVSAAVKETILQNALKDSGVLKLSIKQASNIELIFAAIKEAILHNSHKDSGIL
ncbi:guanine nucleotide binding protein, alpha subunit [Mycena floridula]|nr:guanine nucleotide binding protein, alpha subunit [Mycena floridula]